MDSLSMGFNMLNCLQIAWHGVMFIRADEGKEDSKNECDKCGKLI